MGICVPTNCSANDLAALNNLITKAFIAAKWIEDPGTPHYSFTS